MRSILLFVFALLGLLAISSVSAMSGPGYADYENQIAVNQTFQAVMGSLPPRPSGLVTIMLETSHTLELCLQEAVQLKGDLSSCNPGGYFYFDTNSSSNTNNFFSLDEESVGSLFGGIYENNFVGDAGVQTQMRTTTLRGNSVYYVSLKLNDSVSNSSAYFHLNITWDSVGCPLNQIGLANGACIDVTNSSLDKPLESQTIAALSSVYYELDLPKNSNQYLQTSVTLVDSSASLAFLDASNDTNSSLSVAIRRGAVPTANLADAVATGDDGTFTLQIDSPVTDAIYYIEVTNNEESALTYNIQSAAKGCTTGYGPGCSTNVTDLTHNTNATKYTGTGGYQLYYVKNNTLFVGVGLEKLDAVAPTLLASVFDYPSNQSALISKSNQTVNFIYANNNDPSNEWFISVWADEGLDYYLWANTPCPNNCAGATYGTGNSTHGSCNVDTGMCKCDKGYGNLFCEKTGLKLVWIIVIVIVCAIILAIAIGVPVACFLRNRRRARYERV